MTLFGGDPLLSGIAPNTLCVLAIWGLNFVGGDPLLNKVKYM